MEVTVKKIDGKLVAEIPVKDLTDMTVNEGDQLVLVTTTKGPKLMRREDAEDLELARQIMDEDYEVLRRLAQ